MRASSIKAKATIALIDAYEAALRDAERALRDAAECYVFRSDARTRLRRIARWVAGGGADARPHTPASSMYLRRDATLEDFAEAHRACGEAYLALRRAIATGVLTSAARERFDRLAAGISLVPTILDDWFVAALPPWFVRARRAPQIFGDRDRPRHWLDVLDELREAEAARLAVEAEALGVADLV